MTLYRTESGSVYEHDPVANKVRRLAGFAPPTARLGDDCAWSTCKSCQIAPNGALWIIWAVDDGVIKSTVTSKVVKSWT